jgi:NAD(P)-dependent dehydrogenase (short-subunit alcohol dehydrogenase family)
MKLKDRVAIITGASSGIGEAVGDLFAWEGAKLALVAGRNVAAVEKLAQKIKVSGGEALPLSTDLTDEKQVKQLFQTVFERFGRIDILVNSAGIIGSARPIEEMDSEEWDRVFRIDVRGTFLCTKYCLPYMLKQKSGNMINLASVAGMKGSLISPCYGAAKGAVIIFTKSVAMRYAKEGIRINCISPGTIDTPMTRNYQGEGKTPEEQATVAQYFRDRHPIGRFGTAEEVARGALYLASDDSSFVVGVNLPLDGGLSI